MNAETIKYSGRFWFQPENSPLSNEIPGFLYREMDGTPIIEVLERPEFGNILKENYDVVWGTVGSVNFTFFNVKLIQFSELSSIKYSVKYTVRGMEIPSIKEKCFNGCQIKFPDFIHWISDSSSISLENNEESIVIKDNDSVHASTMETVLPDVNLQVSFAKSISRTSNTFTYSKDCYIKCLSSEKQSVEYFLKLTFETSRFISYVMFGKQKCCSLELLIETKVPNYYQVWFPLEQDTRPKHNHLISYQRVKDKLPLMLQQWHTHYNKLIPMVNQLLYPLSFVDFDYIDFLRFAHALEGLHKRFQKTVFNRIAIEKKRSNKKKSKEEDFYRERIKNLKDHLQNLTAINECNIDEVRVTIARNKYTHLGENDVEEDIPKETLYLLTLKCKVLLACGILLVLGLSEQEIENCTHDSELKNIVNYICVKENRRIRF